MLRPIDRIVDLLDPSLNQLHDIDVDEARRRVLSGDPAAVRTIDGSFALLAVDGVRVRMARSLDRPMRYFLAKRHEGPALIVADRIDTMQQALRDAGLEGQFHPSYTRMVPAHFIVDLALVGCPDPIRPTRVSSRLFVAACLPISTSSDVATSARSPTKRRSGCAVSTHRRRSVSASLAASIAVPCSWSSITRCCVLGCRRRASRRSCSISGEGPDVEQARAFLSSVGLSMFLEEVAGRADDFSTSNGRFVCSKTTSRSTSSAPRWGCCSARGFASAIPSGAISPTVTAATRI
ncbi:MAG: hypothetical protein QM736_00815 [Vicinamibacterales bacterium]